VRSLKGATTLSFFPAGEKDRLSARVETTDETAA
jgi:hypothetical protein